MQRAAEKLLETIASILLRRIFLTARFIESRYTWLAVLAIGMCGTALIFAEAFLFRHGRFGRLWKREALAKSAALALALAAAKGVLIGLR